MVVVVALLPSPSHGQHLGNPDEDVDGVQEDPDRVVDGIELLCGVLRMVLGPGIQTYKILL